MEPAIFLTCLMEMLCLTANRASAEEPILLRDPTFETLGKPGAAWKLIVNKATKATATRVENNGKASVAINIPQAADQPWHIQFMQDKVPLEKGTKYRLQVTASADSEHPVNLLVQQQDKPYAMPGLNVNDKITTESTTLTHEFTCTADEPNGKIAVTLGAAGGTVTITSFSLTRVAK